MVLENILKVTGLNIIEFLSWIICGGVFLAADIAVIMGCVAWRGE